MPENQELLDFALMAARQAADHIRSCGHPDPTRWDTKGASDFVTQVDRETEQIIHEILSEHTPGSIVLGEELSPRAGEGDLMWIVDPLDGTTNFLHGYPVYAVSIGAVCNGELVAGVVTDVHRDKTYHASLGQGAWCGDQRLSTSQTSHVPHALIGTGYPFKSLELLPKYLRQFTNVLKATSGIRRGGAAALDLVDVAAGHFDGFWELSLAPWDVAAGTLLVREADGHVTDLAGNHDVVRQGPIVAGNTAIHKWLLEVLDL